FGIAVVLWSVHLNSTEPFRAFAETASPFRDVCRPGARDAAAQGCRMGTDTDPRVLVVGDSHALAIAEALRITAGEKRLSAMLEWDGGCPPLLGNTIFVGETPWTACMRTNEAVMRWLGGPELRSVTGIVLAGAWHIHFGHVAASANDRIGKLSDAMTHTIGEL